MKIKKGKNLFIISGLLLTILITGCSLKNSQMNEGKKDNIKGISDNKSEYEKILDETLAGILREDTIAIVYDSDDRNIGIDKIAHQITFKDNNIILSDNSIGKIKGSNLIIQQPGTYVVSGTINDGQIIVNSEESGTVHLIFDGVSITAKNRPPLFIKNATKTVLTLNKDTKNYLFDSGIYEYYNASEDELDAAVSSNGNLTINGSGNLTVTANYKDGIASKKELKFVGSNVNVKSKENGIKGKDYIAMESGTLSVVAGGDGLKSTNSEDPSLGHVVIDGGLINIKATHEGIQAKTSIKMNNGKVSITSKGDGMHAQSNVYVHDGELGVNSYMDGVQGNRSICITGGKINLTTTEGSSFSTEGSSFSSEGSSLNDKGTTIRGEGLKTNKMIGVIGGTIEIDSMGTAIYSNQFVNIYGGTINVLSGANSIYAKESLNVHGGELIAVGGQTMTYTSTANTSTQYSMIINYEDIQKANTLFHIEGEDGEKIVTYGPTKDYQSLIISSSFFKKGGTYHLYSGGSVTGDELGNPGTNESYSGGNLLKSFEITSIITQLLE